jgi:hypothetical protein
MDQAQHTVINDVPAPLVANDGPVADVVAQEVLAAKMKIIDTAVRQARASGWCEEFENIMGQLFPDGPPDGNKEFVDSDGRSCRGYDRDGFHENGYDREGYDREGFNQNGRDREGYDREGWNAQDWNREGWNRDHTINRDSDEYRARFRFNRNGYDVDGFNRDGVHRDSGMDRERHAQYVAEQARTVYTFDADGYDVNGLNRYGERQTRY